MPALALLLTLVLWTPWSMTAPGGTTHYVRTIPRGLPVQDVFVDGPIHRDLPAALAAAQDGDTIILPAGDYSGELTVQRSVRLLGVGGGDLPAFRGRITVTADGASIVIEQRAARELTHLAEIQLVPDGAGVYNPAFDATPAKLIDAIFTETGAYPPAQLRGAAESCAAERHAAQVASKHHAAEDARK